MDSTVPTGVGDEGLIDVNDVPVSELWDLASAPNLLRSMQRAQASAVREPERAVCAFNSAI